MAPFEKAKNEAAEKHGGYTSDHGTKFRSFEAGADWAYAYAKQEDEEFEKGLENMFYRNPNVREAAYNKAITDVINRLKKFRAGNGET